MSAWHSRTSVGQTVEARLILAHGAEWRRCTVVRKTRTGFPVVEPTNFPGYVLVIDRKSDIRIAGDGRLGAS